MKKIFLSLVFLFGVGTFVMADDTMKVKNDTVAVEDGFKNIDLKEVPQSVKDAIAKKYPESTLKSASLSLKEGKRLRDSILSPIFHSYIFAMYKNESLWI